MHTDIEYIHRISYRLTKFKQIKENLYTFRCPLCGDSEKDLNKTRGYFHKDNKKPSMRFKCHNCGENYYFSQFLELFDNVLYKEYILNKFKTKKRPAEKRVIYSNDSNKMKKLKRKKEINMFSDLPKIADLDNSHPAKQFLLQRQIPEKEFSDLYFAEGFQSWTNTIIPEKFSEGALKYNEPRIVIPFRTYEGYEYAYQGRSFADTSNKFKYITIVVNDIGTRTYGLNRIDAKKDIMVVEGPFDAMFIDNCIAAAGSDLRTDIGDIFVLDCEPRNKHIVKKLKGLLKKDKTIVLLDSLKYNKMDINDLIMTGMTGEEVKSLLLENTYKGVMGTLALNRWSRS